MFAMNKGRRMQDLMETCATEQGRPWRSTS